MFSILGLDGKAGYNVDQVGARCLVLLQPAPKNRPPVISRWLCLLAPQADLRFCFSASGVARFAAAAIFETVANRL